MLLKKDKIVVGRSLSCLFYAWREQISCIILDPLYVYEKDERYLKYDFSFLNANNIKEFEANLIFSLSITNLLILPNLIYDYFQVSENIIEISTKTNQLVTIDAQEIIFFDTKETGLYEVYDFFAIRRMLEHDTKQIINLTGNFVHTMDFVPMGGSSNNIVALSKMKKYQLTSPDYSNGMSHIKVQRSLKKNGLKGMFAMEKAGKRYYKKPSLEFLERIESPIIESAFTFEEVYNMKQKRGKEWKMIESIRQQ